MKPDNLNNLSHKPHGSFGDSNTENNSDSVGYKIDTLKYSEQIKFFSSSAAIRMLKIRVVGQAIKK